MPTAPHGHPAAAADPPAAVATDRRRPLVETEDGRASRGPRGSSAQPAPRGSCRSAGRPRHPGHRRRGPPGSAAEGGAAAGRAAIRAHSTIAPAEQPARTPPRSWTAERGRPDGAARRASGAGGPGRRRTGRSRSASAIAWTQAGSSASDRSRTRTASTSAPRASKCSTPIAAQRRNTVSPSRAEAVGRMTTRGRHARSTSAARHRGWRPPAGIRRRRGGRQVHSSRASIPTILRSGPRSGPAAGSTPARHPGRLASVVDAVGQTCADARSNSAGRCSPR